MSVTALCHGRPDLAAEVKVREREVDRQRGQDRARVPAGARPLRAGRVRLPAGPHRAPGQPRPGADQRPGGPGRQAGEQARRSSPPRCRSPSRSKSLAAEALEAVRNALDALAKSDAAAARAVIAGDRQIDRWRRTVRDGLTESIRRDPDRLEDWLRLLDIARHLERVGDHAAGIAEAVVYLNEGQIIRHAVADRDGRQPRLTPDPRLGSSPGRVPEADLVGDQER